MLDVNGTSILTMLRQFRADAQVIESDWRTDEPVLFDHMESAMLLGRATPEELEEFAAHLAAIRALLRRSAARAGIRERS
jgi:hypothetical protein